MKFIQFGSPKQKICCVNALINAVVIQLTLMKLTMTSFDWDNERRIFVLRCVERRKNPPLPSDWERNVTICDLRRPIRLHSGSNFCPDDQRTWRSHPGVCCWYVHGASCSCCSTATALWRPAASDSIAASSVKWPDTTEWSAAVAAVSPCSPLSATIRSGELVPVNLVRFIYAQAPAERVYFIQNWRHWSNVVAQTSCSIWGISAAEIDYPVKVPMRRCTFRVQETPQLLFVFWHFYREDNKQHYNAFLEILWVIFDFLKNF